MNKASPPFASLSSVLFRSRSLLILPGGFPQELLLHSLLHSSSATLPRTILVLNLSESTSPPSGLKFISKLTPNLRLKEYDKSFQPIAISPTVLIHDFLNLRIFPEAIAGIILLEAHKAVLHSI